MPILDENSRKITTIVFDKTGTLTEGKFGVTSVTPFNTKFDKKKIIQDCNYPDFYLPQIPKWLHPLPYSRHQEKVG